MRTLDRYAHLSGGSRELLPSKAPMFLAPLAIKICVGLHRTTDSCDLIERRERVTAPCLLEHAGVECRVVRDQRPPGGQRTRRPRVRRRGFVLGCDIGRSRFFPACRGRSRIAAVSEQPV